MICEKVSIHAYTSAHQSSSVSIRACLNPRCPKPARPCLNPRFFRPAPVPIHANPGQHPFLPVLVATSVGSGRRQAAGRSCRRSWADHDPSRSAVPARSSVHELQPHSGRGWRCRLIWHSHRSQPVPTTARPYASRKVAPQIKSTPVWQ